MTLNPPYSFLPHPASKPCPKAQVYLRQNCTCRTPAMAEPRSPVNAFSGDGVATRKAGPVPDISRKAPRYETGVSNEEQGAPRSKVRPRRQRRTRRACSAGPASSVRKGKHGEDGGHGARTYLPGKTRGGGEALNADNSGRNDRKDKCGNKWDSRSNWQQSTLQPQDGKCSVRPRCAQCLCGCQAICIQP